MSRQAFGQHFLVNAGVIQKILDALDLSGENPVLEIGPGRGALTFPLLKTIKDPKQLLLIEKDPRMVEFLQERFEDSAAPKLWQDDFLQVPWLKIVTQLGERFSVVSNLPYESSVAIFLRLLENLTTGSTMVLMFQKEVAERLQAKPGTKDYGSLSVYAQVFAQIKKLCLVSPNSFQPPPRVESMVLKIKTMLQPLLPLAEKDSFEALLRQGFAGRRKMLRQKFKDAGLKPAVVEDCLQAVQASPQARAEEMSPEQWVAFYGHLKTFQNKPSR